MSRPCGTCLTCHWSEVVAWQNDDGQTRQARECRRRPVQQLDPTELGTGRFGFPRTSDSQWCAEHSDLTPLTKAHPAKEN